MLSFEIRYWNGDDQYSSVFELAASERYSSVRAAFDKANLVLSNFIVIYDDKEMMTAFKVSDLPVRAAVFLGVAQMVFGFSGILFKGKNIMKPEPWQIVAAANNVDGYSCHENCLHADIIRLWFRGKDAADVVKINENALMTELKHCHGRKTSHELAEIVAEFMTASIAFDGTTTRLNPRPGVWEVLWTYTRNGEHHSSDYLDNFWTRVFDSWPH